MSDILLQMVNINKRFPGVHALKGASLELRAGETLGLMGENGAGKSTLMNVLGGVIRPDSGDIFISGNKVTINGVQEAQANGVAFIHQELALEPHLTIAENIFLGRELKNSLGLVDRKKMNREAQKYLDIVGLNVRPTTKVVNLTTGKQQMLEIAKAFSLNARILVMDEPTSSLSESEVHILFNTIRDLKKRGIGIIYISHKMQEIFELTDRVTVMRDGEYIGTMETAQTTQDELVNMMVGRNLENYYVRTYNEPGETVLEVENVSSGQRVKNCSFYARRGEILGFYGLVGAGRSELMEAIMGLSRVDRGTITINGKQMQNKSSSQIQKERIVLLPESRKTEGLIISNTIAFNTTITQLHKFMNKLRVNRKVEKGIAHEAVRRFGIKTPSINQRVNNLSGGNQQKVVVAKWLMTDPDVVIADEPTRGIDVGAKAEIYSIINDLVGQNKAVIMVSSELNEIINMCDRLYIMSEGTIVAELMRDQFDQDTILSKALGGNSNV